MRLWFFIRDCENHRVIVQEFRRDHCPVDGMSVFQAIVAFLLSARKNKLPQKLLDDELLV
jgi:hypothetical protein